MAEIIDAFAVTLGLDVSEYRKGQAEADNLRKRTTETTRKTALEMETSGKRAGSAFGGATGKLLAFATALAGATGVAAFAARILTANAAVGTLSANLGLAPGKVAALQGAMETLGGSAGDADAVLKGLAGAYQDYKLTGVLKNANEFRALGINNANELANPLEAVKALSENRTGLDRPEYANMLGRLGFTDAGVALLAQGRDNLEKMLAEQEKLNPVTAESVEAGKKFTATLVKLKYVLMGITQGPLAKFVLGLEKIAIFMGALPDQSGGKAPKSGAPDNWFTRAMGALGIATFRQNTGDPGGKNTGDPAGMVSWIKGKGGISFGNHSGGTVTSGFGHRVHPNTGKVAMHNGIDIRAATGTPIYATHAGTVSRAQFAGNAGNMVTLKGEGGLSTTEMHMSRFAVRPGERVNKGQLLGYSGATGRVTGAHRHYEVRRNGTAIDPRGTEAQALLARANATVRQAGARPGAGGGGAQTTNVGTITVNVARGNAETIAKELPAAIKRRGMTAQANRGLS